MSPTLQDLPPDALLTILSHLTPADVTSLQTAFPPHTHLHALTTSPYIWHIFFVRQFPPSLGIIPSLVVTPSGTLDWCTAYRRAEVRQRKLKSARAAGWRLASADGSNGNVRLVVRGNVRRVVSATADDSAANVVTDPRSRVTRFDWTRRDES